MNKSKKITIIILSIIAALLTAFLFVLWTVRGDILSIGLNKFFISPNYNKTDSFLKTNIEELSYVAEKLSEMDYETVKIQGYNFEEDGYSMKVYTFPSSRDTVSVPHDLIVPIKALFENGIISISCSCENDYVNFTLWSIKEESRGMIYSGDERKPDSVQLIEVRQLSEPNWYYYVHNYEKAKVLNPEKF